MIRMSGIGHNRSRAVGMEPQLYWDRSASSLRTPPMRGAVPLCMPIGGLEMSQVEGANDERSRIRSLMIMGPPDRGLLLFSSQTSRTIHAG